MAKEPKQFSTVVNEKTSAVYSAQLEDENGVPIGSGIIDSLTLTLSNVDDGAIVNSRNAVNALNANDVVVTSGGLLTYTMQPADTAIVDTSKASEVRRATFQMQFNTVSFSTWDVDFVIRNLTQVS